MKISAVVISFNPQCDLLFNNILSYSRHVDQIIVVDNSTELDVKKEINEFCSNNQYIYHDMSGNRGIAAALNVGFNYAIKSNSEWVLTMDQDSNFVSDLEGYKSQIIDNTCSDVLLLIPIYDYHNMGKLEGVKSCNPIIAPQSGNLVKLSNYNKLGLYREDYFIDFVDYEYCLRAKSKGLVLHQINTVILNHKAGEKKTVSFLGIQYDYFEAAPIRYYYVVRNGLKTALIYKDFRSLIIVLKTAIRIVFIEKNKLEKLKFVSRGVVDFFKPSFFWGGIYNDK